MEAYLFSGCAGDAVTQGLGALLEDGDKLGYFAAFSRLLDFARREGVTQHTIREYGARLLLEEPRIGELLATTSMEPYLERDIATLYALYFATDWESAIRGHDLLPPPPGTGETEREDYRAWMERLVAADSPRGLLEEVVAFFDGFSDCGEALCVAHGWDGRELSPIAHPDPVTFEQLGGLAYQKRMLLRNTAVFLEGGPANDILLVGGSGTGKSSCVKATLNHFSADGLRLVELRRRDIDTLPRLLRVLRDKKCNYIVFIDDLTFDTTDESYMGLKVALDGQVEARPANVRIYATSNHRGLVRDAGVPAFHGGDADDTLSLAARFGIHLYFSSLTRAEYGDVVELLLVRSGLPYSEEVARSALAWSETNGGRSGRSAKQFISQYLAR